MNKIAKRIAQVGAVLILAAPTALAATSASAESVATGHATANASATVSPQITVSCAYGAIAPSQPVYHGSAYGQAQITSCVGPPIACHLVVDLQKLEPQGYYVNVQHGDRPWGPCNGNILSTKPYTCPGGFSNSTFISLASLTVEAPDGSFGTPDSVYSKPATLACT
jgi:hypothetical protein